MVLRFLFPLFPFSWKSKLWYTIFIPRVARFINLSIFAASDREWVGPLPAGLFQAFRWPPRLYYLNAWNRLLTSLQAQHCFFLFVFVLFHCLFVCFFFCRPFTFSLLWFCDTRISSFIWAIVRWTFRPRRPCVQLKYGKIIYFLFPAQPFFIVKSGWLIHFSHSFGIFALVLISVTFHCSIILMVSLAMALFFFS